MGDMTGPKSGAGVEDAQAPVMVQPINDGMPSGGSPGDGVLAPGPTGGSTFGANSNGFRG